MKRVQIQLDEPTYEALRREAFVRHESLSSVVRELVQKGLDTRPPNDREMRPFSFVGAGASGEAGRVDRVSERHDEFLGNERW